MPKGKEPVKINPQTRHTTSRAQDTETISAASNLIDFPPKRKAMSMTWHAIGRSNSIDQLLRHENEEEDERILNELKSNVDMELEDYVSTINYDLVRHRFLGSEVSVTSTTSKIRGSENLTIIRVLEELRDIATRLLSTSTSDLRENNLCLKLLSRIMKLQRQYPEYKSYCSTLLFLVSPLSRAIALHQEQVKRKNSIERLPSGSKIPTVSPSEPSPPSRPEFLQAAIMMVASTLGTGVGVTLTKTLKDGKVVDLGPTSSMAGVLLSPRRSAIHSPSIRRKGGSTRSPQLREEFVQELDYKKKMLQEQRLSESDIRRHLKDDAEKVDIEKLKHPLRKSLEDSPQSPGRTASRTSSTSSTKSSVDAIQPVFLICRVCEHSFDVGVLPGHIRFCQLANKCCDKNLPRYERYQHLLTAIAGRMREIEYTSRPASPVSAPSSFRASVCGTTRENLLECEEELLSRLHSIVEE